MTYLWLRTQGFVTHGSSLTLQDNIGIDFQDECPGNIVYTISKEE